MRKKRFDIKTSVLVLFSLVHLIVVSTLRADDVVTYTLAGLTLCIDMEEAKSRLKKAGFVVKNEKFIKVDGNVQHIISLKSNSNDAKKQVTAIQYVEQGQYSPVEFGNMINNEKQQFEKLYGKPAGCDSTVATMFAFSCYYGDKQKSKPLLTISANRNGKKHSLQIEACGTQN